MKNVKHILMVLATYGLLATVLLPSLLQFQHIFEDHHHTYCGNVDTHLHAQEFDCDFTTVVTPIFSHVPTGDLHILNTPVSTVAIENYTPEFTSQISHHYLLRGPPSV